MILKKMRKEYTHTHTHTHTPNEVNLRKILEQILFI
jgi:hypothetical protein